MFFGFLQRGRELGLRDLIREIHQSYHQIQIKYQWQETNLKNWVNIGIKEMKFLFNKTLKVTM